MNADALKSEHDFDMARERVMHVLREHFRPEFLNRVDDTVIFRPLGNAQMGAILDCGWTRCASCLKTGRYRSN